jgi:hypothetical protein
MLIFFTLETVILLDDSALSPCRLVDHDQAWFQRFRLPCESIALSHQLRNQHHRTRNLSKGPIDKQPGILGKRYLTTCARHEAEIPLYCHQFASKKHPHNKHGHVERQDKKYHHGELQNRANDF